MSVNKLEEKAREILAPADVIINGDRPWDIQVHNTNLYRRVFSQGSLGLGEAYMDGWWDAKALDELFYRILRARLDEKISRNWRLALLFLKARLLNLQSRSRAFRIGEHHYDIGNELYSLMLGKTMAYSCGYWKNAANLDEAQESKLDLICKKLGLKSGMRVLDIGCGWGSFAKFAAGKYGVEVVGITVSREQVELGKQRCRGLPVTIRLQDYRDVNEKFDHVVSVGMIEHVGYKNYRVFMEIVHRSLKDDGLFLLHTIGGNQSTHSIDPWTEKYIFPNSMLPSARQITTAIEGLFVMEDWHNFGAYYDLTLMAWFENFHKGWDKIKSRYNDRFYRMWKYYLLYCAGSFRARKNQLWQIVLSKEGVKGGYDSLR
ncbi:MAG: cyclopropane fatty acyl phospholipid synthase [Calditrichaeota bacterium]|nr:cyclopropane fatty acyl phospholipid synthase [Calditrichota bacterium]